MWLGFRQGTDSCGGTAEAGRGLERGPQTTESCPRGTEAVRPADRGRGLYRMGLNPASQQSGAADTRGMGVDDRKKKRDREYECGEGRFSPSRRTGPACLF